MEIFVQLKLVRSVIVLEVDEVRYLHRCCPV